MISGDLLHVYDINRECASLLTCLAISIRAHTSLLKPGGETLASKYKSSTLVGFRHHMIVLHDWLSSGSSRYACFDPSLTGAAYLSNE